MKFLSLFDGCHMFGHALRNVGAECVAVSEIEPHASAVTRYHYPDTPNLGDVRNVDATNFDCLLGGWPCQGNSVAGNRGGLADERSGLFAEIVRILGAASPRWFLLENNPGLFSVNDRRDFGACIGALGKLGYAVGWRVFDAQHFGVPQRRRRIFFVGCLGDPRRSAKVLFEPESVRGDSPPSRAAREGAARETGASVAGCLRTGGAFDHLGDESALEATVARCPTTSNQRIDAETETFIVDAAQVTSKDNRSNPNPGDPSPTLAKTGRPLAFNWRQPNSMPNAQAPTLDGDGDGSGSIAVGPRRLMPIECERLQGLPDDWTRYGRKPDGTVYELKDSPRYHMIGNGGAVPVVEWIGRRMMEAHQ